MKHLQRGYGPKSVFKLEEYLEAKIKYYVDAETAEWIMSKIIFNPQMRERRNSISYNLHISMNERSPEPRNGERRISDLADDIIF